MKIVNGNHLFSLNEDDFLITTGRSSYLGKHFCTMVLYRFDMPFGLSVYFNRTNYKIEGIRFYVEEDDGFTVIEIWPETDNEKQIILNMVNLDSRNRHDIISF